MRGEHRRPRMFSARALGSSPHARGAQFALTEHRDHTGIIPACAGSTPPAGSPPVRPWDHPRMRGEHLLANCEAALAAGSSPHARGALALADVCNLGVGIIPACAGSTAVGHHGGAERRDHPRMRGEHLSVRADMSASSGSSPHARGAPELARVEGVLDGIIPACAGSTASLEMWKYSTRDHPRMRGEHGLFGDVEVFDEGSSPHARGALVSHIMHAVLHRIIPACAGSTDSASSPLRRRRDHPRMRGEHR